MLLTKTALKAELRKAIIAMKREEQATGKVCLPLRKHFPYLLKTLRQHFKLSQSSFAALMGMSVRTLQEWEQGRKVPSGPARALIKVAQKHAEVFVDT